MKLEFSPVPELPFLHGLPVSLSWFPNEMLQIEQICRSSELENEINPLIVGSKY